MYACEPGSGVYSPLVCMLGVWDLEFIARWGVCLEFGSGVYSPLGCMLSGVWDLEFIARWDVCLEFGIWSL